MSDALRRVDSWLTENGIEPNSVCDSLKSLLMLCDSNPEWVARLRTIVQLDEMRRLMNSTSGE